MKFTSYDLMKAIGLNIGDKIKDEHETIYIITPHEDSGEVAAMQYDTGYYLKLLHLIDLEFEILPRLKHVGDLCCKEFNNDGEACSKCPIRVLCSAGISDNTSSFYELLEHYKALDEYDQEIYDLLKARLDKVMEE